MAYRVIVASTNPVKLEATRQGFERVFPGEQFVFSGMSVASGVSDQPITQAETLQGALNRATRAAEAEPTADFTVGIEGGIEDEQKNQNVTEKDTNSAKGAKAAINANAQDTHAMRVFAWIVVKGQGRLGKAQTGVFYLPEEVAMLVRAGMELGDADDQVFGQTNSKQANGSIGLLTNDALTRTDYYMQAVVMALIPFKNRSLTFPAV